MHPSIHAAATPDRTALIMAGTGQTYSYGELERRSNRVAHLFRDIGLKRGDVIAIFMENSATYFDIVWGAQRSGLYYVAISARLTPSELAYILADCSAAVLIASDSLAETAREAVGSLDTRLFLADAPPGTPDSLADACRDLPETPIADESSGSYMLYSSGTTGRPKGIRPPLPAPPLDTPPQMMRAAVEIYGMTPDSVYLSPAPLYHAAPLRWVMTVQALGGTVIVMDKFDAEQTLHLIDRHRVTHGQFVPTHFSRMLALPAEKREQYDLGSLVAVFHAAAPCPRPVKEAMMEWWGPIVYEYYAGSEGNGITIATPQAWLEHKGTVGKAFNCEVKICDDAGEPLPVGAEGTVYFANGPKFEYHNDPEKTLSVTNRYGWTTLGDIGRLDEDGFLFLTDRKSFTIISGGVNIYPQEIENLLQLHPAVEDAAVVGAPHADFGEMVAAVIQPVDPAGAGEQLAIELLDYLRPQLSSVKLPKRIDFMAAIPREPTGKLFKRVIRDAYRGENPAVMGEIEPGWAAASTGAPAREKDAR